RAMARTRAPPDRAARPSPPPSLEKRPAPDSRPAGSLTHHGAGSGRIALTAQRKQHRPRSQFSDPHLAPRGDRAVGGSPVGGEHSAAEPASIDSTPVEGSCGLKPEQPARAPRPSAP